MKVETVTVLVIEDYVTAIQNLDRLTNDFIMLHKIISIGGVDFLPPPSPNRAPILSRTIIYEDDELRTI